MSLIYIYYEHYGLACLKGKKLKVVDDNTNKGRRAAE